MVTENRIRQGGMRNLGNTGYLEVILQTLYHSREFRQIVLGLDLTDRPRDIVATFEMVKELQKMFQEWRVLETTLPPAEDPHEQIQHETLRLVYAHINPFIGPIGHVDPTAFLAALKNCIHLHNSLDDPNDAHEFYNIFLRKLHTFFQVEPVAKAHLQHFRNLFVMPQVNVLRCVHCGSAAMDSNGETSNAHQEDRFFLKQGLQRNTLGYCYDCPIPITTSNNNNDMTESLSQSHLTPHFQQALRQGYQTFAHVHRGRCTCRSDDVLVPTRLYRAPMLQSLPKILTTRFKRWPLFNRNAYMEFDEYLDISDDEKSSTLQYRLLSVIVHHGGGGGGSGRYFSFCRSGDQWGQFWGTQVQPVDWATVQKESFGGHNGGRPTDHNTNVGYMLFYELVDPSTPPPLDLTPRASSSLIHQDKLSTPQSPTTVHECLTDSAMARMLQLVSL